MSGRDLVRSTVSRQSPSLSGEPPGNRQSQRIGNVTQSPVVRPQFCPCGQLYGGEQVRIDIAAGAPNEGMRADEVKPLRRGGDAGARKIRKCIQQGFALAKIAKSKPADDERVDEDRSRLEQRGERLVACTQMIDPDGRI